MKENTRISNRVINSKIRCTVFAVITIVVITVIVLAIHWGNQKYKKYGTFGTLDHLIYLTVYFDNTYIMYNKNKEVCYKGNIDEKYMKGKPSLSYDNGMWFFVKSNNVIRFHKITKRPVFVTIH